MVQAFPELSFESGVPVYRPAGEFTFQGLVEIIDAVLAYCVENGHANLLVDITEVTGFPPPSTAQRFDFATKWAATAGGLVAVAMVAPPQMIDPDRIGVTMSNNRGLKSEVFTEFSDALEWLRSSA